MFKKVLVLAAGVGGYVLGTRAGRGRYEQIKTQADKVWSNPKVQQAASDAQDFAAEKAPVVREKATAAAQKTAQQAAASVKDVADQAKEKVSGSSDEGKHAADDLEGIDLVAAASDVPEEPKHG